MTTGTPLWDVNCIGNCPRLRKDRRISYWCILGKYFHAQDQVSRKLLEEKISEIYGFNKSISNTIDYSISTLVEAGFIERPTAGIYTKPTHNAETEIALAAYRESFFINNPLLNRNND